MSFRRFLNLNACVVLVLTLALWELAYRMGWIPNFLFPSPLEVTKSLFENRLEFKTAFLQTLQGTLLGFFCSLLLGTFAALMFSMSEFLKKAILPFAVFFQTIPIIAVAPLLVIYFGFGLPTVVAASFIVSLFPIVANTLIGLESISPGALELFQLYGASRGKVLFKLRLPSAYPMMYTGWKVAIGLSIIGAIAGEFVAGGGLGAMIDSARTQQRIDLVYGALVLLSVMGLGLISILKLFHRTLQNHRPYGLHLKE